MILFASFIYYAHEENFYWNKPFSHIDKTLNELKENNINAILMSPGQELKIDKEKTYRSLTKENKQATNFWKEKYDKIKITEFSETQDIDSINELYINFLNKIKSIIT